MGPLVVFRHGKCRAWKVANATKHKQAMVRLAFFKKVSPQKGFHRIADISKRLNETFEAGWPWKSVQATVIQKEQCFG